MVCRRVGGYDLLGCGALVACSAILFWTGSFRFQECVSTDVNMLGVSSSNIALLERELAEAKDIARKARSNITLLERELAEAKDIAKKAQDNAKNAQEDARKDQDNARKVQDDARQAQDDARKAQDKMLGKESSSVVKDAQEISSPRQVIDASKSARRPFSSPPPPGTFSKVGITVVADTHFQKRFEVSIASLRCYAQRHHYEFIVLDPNRFPRCSQRDFFFRKHCTVARFLESKPPNYILFVMDGDNPAVLLDRGLDDWIAEAAATDVVVYERWMNNEIMAGNYAVRNSEWGIEFCDGWASYDQVDQPRGFHSSDNGAIHLHLLRALRIAKWRPCATKWSELATGSLDPYYEFVTCTRLLMGAPRRWKLDGVYRVTILPRGHAWSIDGLAANTKISSIGAVTHHGQKTRENYLQYFTSEFVSHEEHACSKMLKGGLSITKEDYGAMMSHSLKDRLTGSFHDWSRQVPPWWDWGYVDCMKTLSCRPLDDDETLPFTMPRPQQGGLPFIRVPQDAKFKWCAKEWEQCSCVGLVRFGIRENGKLSSPVRVKAKQGRLACRLDTFGHEDPAVGDGKHCYCASGH